MIKVLKAAVGLDPDNLLAAKLGDGFEVAEFDPSQPLIGQVGDAAILVLRDVPVTAAVIDAAPKLILLQRYGQHLVGVDIRHARAKGVWVARAPVDVVEADTAVAEHAFMLLLAVAKRCPESQRNIRQRIVGRPATTSVAGKTLGLVGVGKTGAELARLARGFGMRVIAVKRTADNALAVRLGMDYCEGMDRCAQLLAESDFVSIHLPLLPGTVELFDERMFAAMRRGAFLINIARGPIVKKSALVDALASGRLTGAGLDVFWQEPIDPDDPVLQFPNVVATPHIAGATHEMLDRLATIVAENIRRVASGQPPLHEIDEAPAP